jgi:hypothetical protein
LDGGWTGGRCKFEAGGEIAILMSDEDMPAKLCYRTRAFIECIWSIGGVRAWDKYPAQRSRSYKAKDGTRNLNFETIL